MPRETDWYPGLVDLATQYGWLVHHQRTSIMQSGKWASAIMGHKGYPDFTFVHPGKGLLWFREIKGARTTVEPKQKVWLAALAKAGADVDIWRMPADWPKAVAALSFGRGTIQLPML